MEIISPTKQRRACQGSTIEALKQQSRKHELLHKYLVVEHECKMTWMFAVLYLFEHPVGNIGFQIPIDQCISGEIECGMRNHRYPYPSCTSKYCAENKSGDDRLLDTGKALDRVVEQPEPQRGQ